MRFRPCIDLHAGIVKQIVGSTLVDDPSALRTNFEAKRPAAEFADMYRRDNLEGGHVIMLGPGCEEAAFSALAAYPGGLQVGGGINPKNAAKYLEAGASHVIVTSYVFREGRLDIERLEEFVAAAGGPDRVILDLSCRRHPSDPLGPYYVVMDKWKTFTDMQVTKATLKHLSTYCAEFLVHGVDVEGKGCGIEESLVQCLGLWSPIPITYAGGCRSLADLERVGRLSAGRVDVTIGSALDIFGGNLSYTEVVEWDKAQVASSAECGGLPPPPIVVYKVVSKEEGATPGKAFAGSGLDVRDGFVHASDAGMVTRVAQRFFAGRSDLCLMSVRLDHLPDVEMVVVKERGAVKAAEAGAAERDGFTAVFLPDGCCHFYTPLAERAAPTVPAEAVVAVEQLPLSPGGEHIFPPYVTGSAAPGDGAGDAVTGEDDGNQQGKPKRQRVETEANGAHTDA